MVSSEEEGEIGPESVTNFYLVNGRGAPVCFTILPLQWSESEIPDGLKEQLFLRGTFDNGLHKIYKQVIAWKFDLSYVQPEILVLSKNKTWIALQKPRKSFESIIRKILTTVHCLHFVKKNSEASEDFIWNHIVKKFSSYEVKPSKDDLCDHIPLISEAAKRDKDLKKSEFLRNILLEKRWQNKISHEDVLTTNKQKFIVGDDEYARDEESDGEDDGSFDHVCAICDNGGEVLCCEGRCMRSFHATIEAGAESVCKSLGFSNDQVEAIQNFLCKNCKFKRHQCYLCGMLGSSDKSSGEEVFPCVSASCGHFYHPECIAKRLHPGDEAQAKVLQNEIAAGESFTCPAHKCFLCKQGEDKMVHELQFAICRRCPKAYHRKCLPKISFEYDTNSPRRAWDDLLPNRILIYCMDHKIIPELGTPERNHVIFSDMEVKMKKQTLKLLIRNVKVVEKKRSINSENFSAEKTPVKLSKKAEDFSSIVEEDGESTKNFAKRFCTQGFAISNKQKITGVTLKSGNDKKSGLVKPYESSTGDANKFTLRNVESTSPLDLRSHSVKPKHWQPSRKIESTKPPKPAMRIGSSPHPEDPEMERRMLALIEKTKSSFDEEKFKKKFKVASTHASNPRNVLDKTITLGKVEASVKAVQIALQKLEAGCSIEDAKAVCEPQILNQIFRWRRKLHIYLAPFLHGARYTSFGRHFTKVEKLEEIVDKVHWYVKNGDMIVDFCCGANDFSCLMKEKLDKMGKSCSFKNYDLIQPKNDFCFEQRDWMTTRSEELFTGSQLIMGLNPPFGVNASLANKFIDKALEFRPKLLVLIVPEETKRLDRKKKVAYDLIWEDDRLLSGKSFYLPGSVDVHDKPLEQRNINSTPLYLWSRSDWTARHRMIAKEHGHLEQEMTGVERNDVETTGVSNYLMEEKQDCYADFSNVLHGVGDFSHILDDIPEDDNEIGLLETTTSPAKQNTTTSPAKQKNESSASDDSSEKMNEMQCKEKKQRGQPEASLQGESDAEERPESNEMSIDVEIPSPLYSPINFNNLQGLAPNNAGTETSGRGLCNPQPSSSVDYSHFGAEYGTGANNPSHIGNPHNLTNGKASLSSETYNPSRPQNQEPLSHGGDVLPYQYPPLDQFASQPYVPYGYSGPAVYNSGYGCSGSAVHNAGYGYSGSAVHNAGYGYSGSAVHDVGYYGHLSYAAYDAPMCTPAGHTDPSMSDDDLKPPGVVSATSYYTAPVPTFNAQVHAPIGHIAPNMDDDLRPPGVVSATSYYTAPVPTFNAQVHAPISHIAPKYGR